MANRSILCFGDSLTAGYAKHGRVYYPYSTYLTKILSKQNATIKLIENSGISGDLAIRMPERLEGKLQRGKKVGKPFDVLVILCGTNDIGQLVAEEDVAESYAKLHDIAAKHGILYQIWLTVPELSWEMSLSDFATQLRETRRRCNTYISNMPQKNNDCFVCDLASEIPYETASEAQRKEWWDDGVHFTAAGYEKMAGAIATSILTADEVVKARGSSDTKEVVVSSVDTTTKKPAISIDTKQSASLGHVEASVKGSGEKSPATNAKKT